MIASPRPFGEHLSTLLRLACASLAVLLLTTGCATPADPVLAPVPTGAPDTGPGEPTGSPRPATAAPGEQVVPLDCLEAMPELVAEYDMRLAEPLPLSVADATERTAGLHSCRFEPGSSGLWVRFLIYPVPEEDWVEVLRRQGGVDIDGGVEQRYCWGDIAEASHCGIRWGLGTYAAELFVNGLSSAGDVAALFDEAAAEMLRTLRSLDAPVPRSEADTKSVTPFEECETLALGGSSIAEEIPWVTAAPVLIGTDDAPMLFLRALQRTGVVHCEWWQPTVGEEFGFDHADFVAVPGGGWAFDQLAADERVTLAGADEASAVLVTDAYGSSVKAFARIGDDLISLAFTDVELNGLIAADRPALALRLLEPIVAKLVAGGIIG